MSGSTPTQHAVKAFDLTITDAHQTALTVFSRQYRTAQKEDGPPLRRTIALDEARRAAMVLSRPEQALVVMVSVNGRSIKDVAAQTGRQPDELLELLICAAGKLASHYEATGG